jgi:hypothetical protein
VSTGERLSAVALLRALGHDWAVIQGAAIPLLALVLAAIAGAGQQTAVSIALWSAAGTLVALELLAGMRSKASPRELSLDLAVGVTMGLAILVLKVLLH